MLPGAQLWLVPIHRAVWRGRPSADSNSFGLTNMDSAPPPPLGNTKRTKSGSTLAGRRTVGRPRVALEGRITFRMPSHAVSQNSHAEVLRTYSCQFIIILHHATSVRTRSLLLGTTPKHLLCETTPSFFPTPRKRPLAPQRSGVLLDHTDTRRDLHCRRAYG